MHLNIQKQKNVHQWSQYGTRKLNILNLEDTMHVLFFSKVVRFKEELNIYVCKQQIKCMIKSTLIYKEKSISDFEKRSGHNMSDIFKMS